LRSLLFTALINPLHCVDRNSGMGCYHGKFTPLTAEPPARLCHQTAEDGKRQQPPLSAAHAQEAELGAGNIQYPLPLTCSCFNLHTI
uniref:Uncharacterized protein n=1 Tax=Gouania willdenowi TaxID=441366 RepID=A0A8C5ND04_GOUWI